MYQSAIAVVKAIAETNHMDNKGQIGGVTTLIGLGIAIYVVVTLFTALSLNTGLYATVLTTLLPLLVVGVVAAILIALFR